MPANVRSVGQGAFPGGIHHRGQITLSAYTSSGLRWFCNMTDAVDGTAGQLNELKVDEPPKTVLHSPEDFTSVHPLTHEWTLWYTKPPSGEKNEDWHDLLKELVTVSTVEEFWGAYNAIPKVSELPRRSDYALFRKGVGPEWEDPANAKGGKWIYQHRQQRPDAADDDRWLNVLLGIIGGTLDPDPENQQVNGVFAMVRHGTLKIALWVTGSHEKTEAVALRFKELLDLDTGSLIEYNLHDVRSKNRTITL